MGCKKNYNNIIKPESKVENFDFFKLPSDAPSAVKRIGEKMKLDNEKHNFLASFAKNFGVPVWEKSKISTKSSATSKTNSNDTITLIPLVIPNQTFVNGFLNCVVNEDSVAIQLYNGQEYQQYGYSTNPNNLNAQKIAVQIIAMEYEVFGHDIYKVKDNNLFVTPNTANATQRKIKIVPSENNSRDAFYYQTYCYVFLIDEDQGQLVGCTHGSFSNCTCNSTTNETYCINVLQFNETSSGSSNGGGGNSNYWSGNNTNTGGVSGNGSNVSSSNLGWEFYPNSMTYSQHFSTWQVTMADGNRINNWKNNKIDKTNLDPCLQTILDELLNCSGTNPIGRMLAKFDRATGDSVNIEKFNISYATSQINPLGATTGLFAAYTTPLYFNANTNEFGAIIFIDSAISSKASDLYNATTLIHESIHAYLAYLLYRRNISNTTPYPFSWYQTKPLDTLFNVYVDTLVALEKRYSNNFITIDTLSSLYDHNFMANKLINLIAETIKKYADAKGIPGITDEYVWKLAWSGLTKTDVFMNHWSNNPNFPVQSNFSLTTVDSTRGLKYALTPQWCQEHRDVFLAEKDGTSTAKGRLRNTSTGCY